MAAGTRIIIAVCAALALQAGGESPEPADDLEYWLRRAQPATTQPAGTTETDEAISPRPSREDALPGVVELSDGSIIAGMLYTTREHDWSVYVEGERLWRRVPFLCVLGIRAVVVEEKMEPRWRWKAMGEPERVYTGAEYPARRLEWKFRLIDGSEIAGTVKGQPLWVERDGRRLGPFILHERSSGRDGESLADLVYVRRVIVSRRMMEAVMESQSSDEASSKPGT